MKLYSKSDIQIAVSQYAKGFTESSVSKTVICSPSGSGQNYQRQGWEDAQFPRTDLPAAKLTFADAEKCGDTGEALVRHMRGKISGFRDEEFGGSPEQRAAAHYQVIMRAGEEFAANFERKSLVSEVVAQLRAEGFDVVPSKIPPVGE